MTTLLYAFNFFRGQVWGHKCAKNTTPSHRHSEVRVFFRPYTRFILGFSYSACKWKEPESIFFFGCWSHLDPGRTWGNVLFFATCSQYCTNADSFDQRSLPACSQFLGRRLFFVDALYERKIAHPTDPGYSNTRCCSPKRNGFEAILDAKCYLSPILLVR